MAPCTPILGNIIKEVTTTNETLEQYGKRWCPNVKDPRDKAKRLVVMALGMKYLYDNAERLGYHVSHIRNPEGRSGSRKKLNQKERQVQKIKEVITKSGEDCDYYDVEAYVDSTLTLDENMETFVNTYPEFKPDVHRHYYGVYEPTLLDLIEVASYDELIEAQDEIVNRLKELDEMATVRQPVVQRSTDSIKLSLSEDTSTAQPVA